MSSLLSPCLNVEHISCDVITYIRFIVRIRILCLVMSCNNKVIGILQNLLRPSSLLFYYVESAWIVYLPISLIIYFCSTRNAVDLQFIADSSMLCNSFVFTLITHWVTENTSGLVHCGITASYGNLLVIASLEKYYWRCCLRQNIVIWIMLFAVH